MTLVGPTSENLVIDTLAVLHLNNQLHILFIMNALCVWIFEKKNIKLTLKVLATFILFQRNLSTFYELKGVALGYGANKVTGHLTHETS